MASTSPAKSPPLQDIDPARMRQHADSAAQLLKALANEKRLQILCLLAEHERPVHELNAMLVLSLSALSQHLAVLREENMVQTRREAQSIFYSLVPGPALEVIQTLHGIFCNPAGAGHADRAALPQSPLPTPSNKDMS